MSQRSGTPFSAALLPTGPRRRVYAVGTALWVGGLVIMFTASYSRKTDLDATAAGYLRAPVGQTTMVVREPGQHALWVERSLRESLTTSTTDAPTTVPPTTEPVPESSTSSTPAKRAASSGQPRQRTVIPAPAVRLADVELTDDAGTPVPIQLQFPPDYRAVRDGRTLIGVSRGVFNAPPGTYHVAVTSHDPSVAGVAVGPVPSTSSLVVVVLGGLVLALVGLATLVTTWGLRRGAARRLAGR